MNVITTIFLERTLADFCRRHFERYRFDNRQVNIAQPSEVPYDPDERAADLTLKVPPTIVCGYVPKTITGEWDIKRFPGVPVISIRAVSGRVDYSTNRPFERCTTTFSVRAFDQNENRQGYQTCLIMLGVLKYELPRFRVIDQGFALVPQTPITWEVTDIDLWPYFFGELTAEWQLPVASHIAEATIQTPWIGEPEEYANNR